MYPPLSLYAKYHSYATKVCAASDAVERALDALDQAYLDAPDEFTRAALRPVRDALGEAFRGAPRFEGLYALAAAADAVATTIG